MFPNGYLPNEIYYIIIDHLQPDGPSRILAYGSVCQAWQSRVREFLKSLSINTYKELSILVDSIKKDLGIHRILQYLNINLSQPNEVRQGSVIRQISFLASPPSSLSQLRLHVAYLDDYHPKILSKQPNTTVQTLHMHNYKSLPLNSLLSFLAFFQSLTSLSLRCEPFVHIIAKHAFIPSQFAKTKASLKSLDLLIYDSEELTCLLDAFRKAGNFVSHLSDLSLKGDLDAAGLQDSDVDRVTDSCEALLECCHGSLEKFTFSCTQMSPWYIPSMWTHTPLDI